MQEQKDEIENPFDEEISQEMMDAAAEAHQPGEMSPEAETAAKEPPVHLEETIAQLQEQCLRLTAELENTRQRSKKQLEESAKYTIHHFAKDIVNVVDDFTRAIHAAPPETFENIPVAKNLYEGVVLIERSLFRVLERHGVSGISPAVGDGFDHHIHQAVAHLPSQDVSAGAILEVMQQGYRIHDRLLRPAMVSVAKAQSE